MKQSDATCAFNSPKHSPPSTFCSLDELLRQPHFAVDPYGLLTTKRRESHTSGKFPSLLWRCSLSARNLLARNRGDNGHIEDRHSLRRHSHGSLFTVTERSSISRSSCKQKELETPTARSSSIGLRDGSEDLQLFRDQAEYSDYLLAHVTGHHCTRSEDGVVFYEVEVHLSKQQWRVVRRFSEFRTLRQLLVKHLSRGKRRRDPHCPICENVLASIMDGIFPSRKVWGSHLFSGVREDDELLRERKIQFQQFVVLCLLTVRSLRQHVRVLSDRTACETSVLLRMIEEFLSLSFARYLMFLEERGIVDQTPKCLLRRSLR